MGGGGGGLITGSIFLLLLFSGKWAYNRGELITEILRYPSSSDILRFLKFVFYARALLTFGCLISFRLTEISNKETLLVPSITRDRLGDGVLLPYQWVAPL